MADKYQRQFAPDGKHFQNVGKPVAWEEAWDWLTQDTEAALQKVLNRFAKIRMVNQRTGQIIGDIIEGVQDGA